jgi:hypothetical protein
VQICDSLYILHSTIFWTILALHWLFLGGFHWNFLKHEHLLVSNYMYMYHLAKFRPEIKKKISWPSWHPHWIIKIGLYARGQIHIDWCHRHCSLICKLVALKWQVCYVTSASEYHRGNWITISNVTSCIQLGLIAGPVVHNIICQ